MRNEGGRTAGKSERQVASWPFSRETVERSEAWVRVHEQMDMLCSQVLPNAGKAELRLLYRRYGELLRECAAEDLEGIPPHGHPETRRAAIALYEHAPARRRVLDGGCGPNPVTSAALAADPQNRVVGMDIGYGTVAVARDLARKQRRRVLFVVGDLEALPFRPSVFDVVICDDTFEHLADPECVLGEVHRVIRPKGEVFITTPNRHSLHILHWKFKNTLKGTRLQERDYYMDRSHIREYSYAEFRRLIGRDFRLYRLLPLGFGIQGWFRLLGTVAVHIPGLRRFSFFIMARLRPR